MLTPTEMKQPSTALIRMQGYNLNGAVHIPLDGVLDMLNAFSKLKTIKRAITIRSLLGVQQLKPAED